MNLIYICDNVVEKGGIERVIIAKANYFADILKYKVTIVVTSNKEKEAFYKISKNIKIIDLNIRKNFIFSFFKYTKKLKQILNELDPNIILVPTGKEGMLIPFIDKKIYKIREIHFSKKSRNIQNENCNCLKKKMIQIYNFMEQKIIQKYDKLVVLTNEDKKEWNHKNIEVIYNPKTIKISKSAELLNKKVISVGRLDYQKGFDRLINVWEKVLKNNEDWILEIYGDGPLREEILEMIKEKKLEKNILLMGATKNIDEKMLDSSIYILSSRHEGLPLVLLEAMECGLPIVSFDCPCGPKDVIKNAFNGYLIKNGEIELMAQSLERLLNNQELRKNIGENSKKESQKYEIEKVMLKWTRIFESCQNNEI